MSATFENWKSLIKNAVSLPERSVRTASITFSSFRCSYMMDTEKKDKIRKKKIPKKETEEGEKVDETSLETLQTGERQNPDDSSPPVPIEILINAGTKRLNASRERKTKTTGGFYITHPRHIKRTVDFKDVHSRKLAELLEAFHMFDFDRDGQINEDDLRKSFTSLCMNVEEEEIKQMMSEALNPLNFDEFVILLGYKTLDLDPEEVLVDALSNWDDHDDGLISYERFMQNIMAWGEKFTEEEAVSALADAPIVLNKTKEKMIDYIQFSEDLCGLRKMMQKRVNEGAN